MTATVEISPTALHTNLSHAPRSDSLQAAVDQMIEKICARQDLPYITVSEQLTLLQALLQFDLGEFLLLHGGLDGYWIDYIVHHPARGRLTGLNNEGEPLGALESFMLDKAPWALATQQRFEIFKQEIQKRLGDYTTLASVPCGMMAELLDVDYSQVEHFSIIGIDLEPEILLQSQQLAASRGLEAHCTFIEQNAWQMNLQEQCDIITSNGLTIYERNDAAIIALYQRFFTALKPGGSLITSFVTPPSQPEIASEWKIDKVDPADALLQRVLFFDILDLKWQAFRSSELVASQLREAGFETIEFIYDSAHMFPTVVATRSEL